MLYSLSEALSPPASTPRSTAPTGRSSPYGPNATGPRWVRCPEQPYVVCDRHTRRVGKDALISFGASHSSVPWRRVRPGARVELRVTPAEVAIWSLGLGQELLATHPRALQRGGWIVDQQHWDGLADRTVQALPPCTDDGELTPAPEPEPGQLELPGIAGWAQLPAARVLVAHRTLATYDHAGGLTGGLR